MANFNLPSNFQPETVSWLIQKDGVQFRANQVSSVSAIEFPGQFWKISVSFPPRTMRDAGSITAFFDRIAGGFETVNIPYWPRRVPIGVLAGTPALSVSAARGDLQLQIGTVGTLSAGDAIVVGGQLFKVFQDCASVSGNLVVPLVNRVHAPITAGTLVIWQNAMCKCSVPSLVNSSSYATNIMLGLPIDFEEVP